MANKTLESTVLSIEVKSGTDMVTQDLQKRR